MPPQGFIELVKLQASRSQMFGTLSVKTGARTLAAIYDPASPDTCPADFAGPLEVPPLRRDKPSIRCAIVRLICDVSCNRIYRQWMSHA